MKWLTKSDYLRFLVHPAYLWLAKNNKAALPEFDEIARANVDQGNAVEAVAQSLFPSGHLIEGAFFDGPELSAEAMRPGGPEVIFQASVLTGDKLYSRSDIIIRQADSWDLYEVKGSTKVKPEHLHDLAFQRHVFMQASHKINHIFVVHINAQYIRRGDIEPHKLFTVEEVTDQVLPLRPSIAKGVIEARRIIELPTCPNDAPELANDWYGWRDVYRHIHPDIPAGSILNLTRLKLAQIQDLTAIGIDQLSDIPDSFNLGPQQLAQVEVAKSGHPHIHTEKILHQLSQLQYPLYFLDYETFASALPLWDGVRPFQQLPFQYSLHVISEPGAPIEHREYLARGSNYPVPDLLVHMEADLGPTGSTIVWNKSFEMGCNDAMAALHPEYADFLHEVNARVFDLMEVFSNGYYIHPGFMGSVSIKKVLPILVPELSYKGLEIGEGMTAQLRWMRAARGEMTQEEATKLYDDLVTYCGQDTLAMVRIFEVLISHSAAIEV